MFTITLVINLQLTGTLTSGMDNGFSLEQLADNIFVPSAYANEIFDGNYKWCFTINGWDMSCRFEFFPQYGCDPWDPDWDPCLYQEKRPYVFHKAFTSN